MKPFKIQSQKTLINVPFCHVEHQIVEIPNGETRDWYLYHSKDAVVIIPQLSDGQILLQKNYKHGSGQNIIEFPAGIIDEQELSSSNQKETLDEDITKAQILSAATRELAEETGYTSQKMTLLGSMYANPTSSPMQYHIVLAQDCKLTQEPDREPEEQIETFLVKDIQTAKKLLTQPKNKSSAATLASLSLMQR